MSVVDSIRRTLVPVHREGIPFIAAFAIAGIVFGLIWPLSLILFVPLTLWCAYFFRDPARVTPADPALVIAPADGRIVAVGSVPVPAELAEMGLQTAVRVCIFMNVFDCHVNRAPVAGPVRSQVYIPGVFVNAELDKASAANERNALVIETETGPVGVVQIAGLVARRIVSFTKTGEALQVGDRFGLIRFGSRLDVYIPEPAAIRVAVGQRTIAGETILANRGDGALPIEKFLRS
ncbi:MAG: phosphatidylserine decarboxylase [Pseudomonadota bacterium]